MRISTIVLTLIILGVGFVTLQVMKNLADKPPVTEKKEPVIVVAVQQVTIAAHRPLVSVIGTIEAKDEASLTSPLETEVRHVIVEEGDIVSKNDSLVTLDVRESNFQLEAQLATLDDIAAQSEARQRDMVTEQNRLRQLRELARLAHEELKRNRQLFARGLVAEAAIDQAEAAMASRQLEIIGQNQRLDALDLSARRLAASARAARAQAGQLRLTLERAEIRAPFAGVVKVVHTSAGTRVSRGAPLVELYDPGTLRLRAAIPNEYAIGAVGALEGRIPTATGKQPAPLLSIAPAAKAGRGTVDALFGLPAAGDWLLGTAVEFDLLLPEITASVAVPFDALYSGNRVYVVDAESRAVAVTCVSVGQTQVTGTRLVLLRCPDLEEGAQVVVNRIPNLISGTKLRVDG